MPGPGRAACAARILFASYWPSAKTIYGVIALILIVTATAMISGQLGYERGDSYSNWSAHFNHLENQRSMEEIGTCRWAELVAGCVWHGDPLHLPVPKGKGKMMP